ncbi:MAG: hypothetical protein D6820_04585 [Lentisphaerae bacterium]|nr:MAG: hypothetical protein D6820_04585 [Lentisphaerota bacterium]
MSRNTMNLLLTVMVGIMTVVTGLAEDKYLVRLNMKKGDTHRFGQVMDNSVTMHEVTRKMHMFSLYEWKCSDAKEDQFTVTVSIKRMVLRQNRGPTKMCFDSANDATFKGTIGLLRAVTHVSYDVVFNKRGEVMDVVIPPDTMATAIKAAGITTPQQQNVAKMMLATIVNKEKLKGQLQEITRGNCPENAVGVGDTWEQNNTITEPFPIQIQGTHKLMKVDGDILHIDYQGKVTTPVQSGSQPAKSPRLTGTQQAKIQINKESGFVVSSDLHQTLSLTVQQGKNQVTNTHIRIVSKKKELEQVLKDEDRLTAAALSEQVPAMAPPPAAPAGK